MTLIKLPVLPVLAVFCIHSAALATQAGAIGSAGSAAHASSSGSMSIGSNGSALSYASSTQSASARTLSTAARAPGSSSVRASIAGETAIQSAGVAFNTSTGSGTGAAAAAGSVTAAARGNVGMHGLTTGDSGGQTRTHSVFVIEAARGQGSAVQGSAASGFETVLNFDCVPGGAVSVSTTGFVTGTNASQTLTGLNAAGLASIQTSGSFSGTGQAAAGAVPRP